jgi:GntR family transcriptional regulator, rspAB operon transcriptional repressor
LNSPRLKSIKSRPTLTGAAFLSIKQAIMGGRLEAGQIYSEQALARELGISKTPVHNALIDLANKGFLTILPQRGFQVGKLTSKDVKDLFVFRKPLEEMVVLQVTPVLGEQTSGKIDQILKNLSDSEDWVTFLKYDRRFHRYLVRLTENTFIINALANIWDLCDWIGARNLAYDGDFSLGLEEHLAIGRKLLAKDPEGAVRAMRVHLKSTETRFLEQMKE